MTAKPKPSRWIALLLVVAAFLAVALYGAICILVWAGYQGWTDRAVGDVRSIQSAQLVYSQTQGGLFESRLKCLWEPRACRLDFETDAANDPAWGVDEPTRKRLIDEGVFIAGATATALKISEARASPTSVESFVYCVEAPSLRHAWWARITPWTPPKALCGDSSGHLCSVDEPLAMGFGEGLCPSESLLR